MAIYKLTVGQYIELYKIAKSETDPTEKTIHNIAIATGRTYEQVEELPINEVNALGRHITSLFNSITLNTKPVSFLSSGNRKYQVNFKPGTLTAGQYTDLQHWFAQDDWILHMDKILASVSVPVKRYAWIHLPMKYSSKDHPKIAEDMQNVDFSQAYGCVVFFCKVFAASMTATLHYFQNDLKEKGKTTQEIQQLTTDLTGVLDGFTTPNG